MAVEFSPETFKKFEETVSRYPKKEAAMLPVLYLAQQEFGYLSPEAIDYVAKYAARCRAPWVGRRRSPISSRRD
jgi:NADH:ubiquinone oxidoreductase subunit E